jgi:Uma2 family endonuclease
MIGYVVPDLPSWAESPEIVVEVRSPSNTGDEIRNKCKAVFARGAGEFWVCDRKGILEFFGPRARLARSRLCPQFPSRIAS